MKFIIYRVYEQEDGYLVTGICDGDSSPENCLKIGDIFLKAYKNIFEKTSLKLIETKDIRDLKLEVKKIVAYRHQLEELPLGMTAELYLTGDRTANLEEKDILSTNNLFP
ncbi:MAG: hypothetical protein QNJ38_09560 [Prochloraceae cyanobacterium]|nr:hypothetical protein [Prochloraceae cyanobacterium]